jgi:hypothetical protein
MFGIYLYYMPNDDEKLVKVIGRWTVLIIGATTAGALMLSGRSDLAMYVGMGILWFLLVSGE